MLVLPLGISVFDHDVAALDVTEVTQSLTEGLWEVGTIRQATRQEAYSSNLRRLLALGAERRSTKHHECNYRFTPVQSIPRWSVRHYRQRSTPLGQLAYTLSSCCGLRAERSWLDAQRNVENLNDGRTRRQMSAIECNALRPELADLRRWRSSCANIATYVRFGAQRQAGVDPSPTFTALNSSLRSSRSSCCVAEGRWAGWCGVEVARRERREGSGKGGA